MKTIFRFTVLLALMAGVCFGQTIIQTQNNGVTNGTFKKYAVLNCTTGVNCGVSGSTVNISVAGTTNAKQFGVKMDTKVIADVTLTNASGVMDCTFGSDCNFTSADVGKVCFGGSSALAQGTISVVTDAQHATCSGVASGNFTHNATVIWGTDDTAAWNTAWTASGAICGALGIPQGFTLFQSAIFGNQTCPGGPANSANNGYQQSQIIGTAVTPTLFIPTPNFNYATCTLGPANHTCFGGAAGQYIYNLKIWGAGNGSTALGVEMASNAGAVWQSFAVTAWCTLCANAVGTAFYGPQAIGIVGGSIGAGATACTVNGINDNLINWPCAGSATGIHVTNTGSDSVVSMDNFFGGTVNAILVDAGSSMYSFGDTDSTVNGAGQIVVNGTLVVDGYAHVGGTNVPPPLVGATGKFIVTDGSKFPQTTTFSNSYYNGVNMVVIGGGVVRDDGTNSLTGVPVPDIPVISQSKSQVTASATSFPVAFTSNVAANDLVVVAFDWLPTTSTLVGCTDTRGNTITQVGSTLNTGSTLAGAVSVALLRIDKTNGAGADTITCTLNATASGTLAAAEFSGAFQGGSTVDVTSTATGASTSISGGAITPTANGNLVMTVGVANRQTVATPQTNYAGLFTSTALDFQFGPGGFFAASQTPTMTSNISSDWAAFSVAFKTAPLTGYQNNPQSGSCTFSGTTCAATFATPFQAIPSCTAGDTTAAAPVKAVPNKVGNVWTTVTLTGGTGAGATDIGTYSCQ